MQRTRRLGPLVLCAILATQTLADSDPSKAAQKEAGRLPGPAQSPGAEGLHFVTSAVCGECHASEFQAWRGSHHDLALQTATASSVLGDFDDAQFDNVGSAARFFKRAGRFYVETAGSDGEPGEYEILYTLGVDPLQQYLVAFPGGRLQALPFAWDTKRKRWFHLYPETTIPPDDALHWTGRYQTWNSMCAECHSTHLEKRYNPSDDSFSTQWAEIDVGCEACHGPGERHVAWARRARNGTPPVPDSATAQPPQHGGLVTDLQDATAAGEIETCARCHARRHRVSEEDLHGRPLMDDFTPALLSPPLYHADGQILDEVYVYGSFMQSLMAARGVRCSDCHEPHSLELRAQGNALCTRCHSLEPDPRFPSLRAALYDTPDHHHHEPGSEGSVCVNCHMPSRVYMGVDPRRDHSFRIPRPDLTLSLGVPNACENCHADEPPEFAANAVAAWSDGGAQRPHFSEAFAKARSRDTTAGRDLARIVQDPAQPAIVRATAVELLRGIAPHGRDAIRDALRDPEPLVRATAAASLDILPPQEWQAAGAHLLKDPSRSVRIEAAQALAPVPRAAWSPAQRHALKAALAEFERAQLANGDFPAAHFNLGVLYTQQQRFSAAQEAFETALERDARFLPAAVNLANLHNHRGRNAQAEQVLRAALAFAPEEGELHYSLGLLLAENEQLVEAEAALGRAAALLPTRARVRYNHALALQHLGRRQQAETALLAALEIAPGDPAITRALTIFYVQDERFERGLAHARQLVSQLPNDRSAQELLRHVEAEYLRRGKAERNGTRSKP
ncbi:tetratricopeptide repeat protein [Myxococcota bacterium]|nr:tetratricopeptide repeat protein [Myxococcota bacterium]